MISVSRLAASVLLQTIRESQVQQGQTLRLVKEDERFTLKVDKPCQTDLVIRFESIIVLVVDRNLDREIGRGRIDIEETAAGHDLVFRMPANPTEIEKRLIRLLQDGETTAQWADPTSTAHRHDPRQREDEE